MATAHPGKWEIVLQSNCVLNTQVVATNSGLIYNPNFSGPLKWRVIYFFASDYVPGTQSVRTCIWDPNNNDITPRDFPNWPPPYAEDPPFLHCSGMAMLADGRVIAGGGHRVPFIDPGRGLPFTYIFEPLNNRWIIPTNPLTGEPHAMADGRWYPCLIILGAGQGFGKVIAMSGYRYESSSPGQSVVNNDPEIYDPINGWSLMQFPDQAKQPFNDIYPSAHVIPAGAFAGKVFFSLPMLQAYIFDPFVISDQPYWVPVGQVRETNPSILGASVLLPLLPPYNSSKVVIMGGGGWESPALNTVETINLTDTSPLWAPVQSMYYARFSPIAITLPTDKILVIGGAGESYFDKPVMTAELLDASDPSNANWTWTLLPAMMAEPIGLRGLHSVGHLLPDGRIFVSGGGENNNLTIEIYSPGYLLDFREGERPVINSAPDNISYGQPFTIETSHQITAIRLIRIGAMTHSINTDQRSIGLVVPDPDLSLGGIRYILTAPPNANIAPPGFYMLFVLRDKRYSISGESMLPSIAKIVKLT